MECSTRTWDYHRSSHCKEKSPRSLQSRALLPRSGLVQYLFCDTQISFRQARALSTICYHGQMTKLLEAAIERLRQLPENMQDSAARAMFIALEEDPEPGDREAIARGREAFDRGEFSTLDELKHDMGLGDH